MLAKRYGFATATKTLTRSKAPIGHLSFKATHRLGHRAGGLFILGRAAPTSSTSPTLFDTSVSCQKMSELATYYLQQMESIKSDFFESGDGYSAIARRTAAVDEIVRGHFQEAFGGSDSGVAAAAVGGYGREQLSPYSDVDLLILVKDNASSTKSEDQIAGLLAKLWDSQLRVSQSVRTPADCTKLAPDNTELHISLLDTRFLCGDEQFFREFETTKLPKFYLREQRALTRELVEAARKRHRSFGNTIYQLEPDLKEGPGGLRDFQLACWLMQLDNLSPSKVPTSEEFLPVDHDHRVAEAKRFLFALRCYLHYFNGRDKNQLTFDLQETVAHEGSGKAFPEGLGVSDWMREFFRNSRIIDRLAARAIDEHIVPQNSLLAMFRNRKSKLSNHDFTVSNGRIFWRGSRQLEASPELGLQIFAFMARTGLPLAAKTERRIEAQLPAVRAHFNENQTHWAAIREILLSPHTYAALRAMRETGVLFELFPSFELVDCLVIRDFYHRYTVDEHTLVTIRVLKELSVDGDKRDSRYARLLEEIDRPDLVYFALLFHDVGKGVKNRTHSEVGAELAAEAMDRVGLSDKSDRDTIDFLIRDHLTMSGVMTKRDISETETLEEFKERVGTLERLKMLTIMTFADMSGVNPQAMTTWRKDLLWQLYLGTHHVFTRDLEDKRIEPDHEESLLDLVNDPEEGRDLKTFLKGFPHRYLRTHTPEQIYSHYTLSPRSCAWRSYRRHPERSRPLRNRCDRVGAPVLVRVPMRRPFRFWPQYCESGSLWQRRRRHSRYLPRLCFRDRWQYGAARERGRPTQEESAPRSRRSDGRRTATTAASKRSAPGDAPSSSREFFFDNETSTRATIFHVTAEDRTGLLFDLASRFSQNECDIDVVLIDTRAHRARDVFYVRGPSGKLDEPSCQALCEELQEACVSRAL